MHVSPTPAPDERYDYGQGVVYKKSTGSYTVHSAGKMLTCALSPRLRKQLVYPIADPHSLRHVVREVRDIGQIDPVAVGDEVRYVDTRDGGGLIVEVLPRRNRLARRSSIPMPGAHAFEQVIVANLDRLVAVFASAQPAPHWNLLDRYLASAESLGLDCLICITKLDLLDDRRDLEAELDVYRSLSYPVLLTSAETGEGLQALRGELQGRASVLIGKSGVGKTTLLNALQPGLGRRVKEVNRVTGGGRHTTTHLEMLPLDFGGSLVDTPGMREFGIWGLEEITLEECFRELRPLLGRCKFGLDCMHESEPGCAVRKAVEQGTVSARRFESFLKLRQQETD